MGIYFLAAAQVFILWKKMATATWIPGVTAITMKLANSPWLSGFTFLSSMPMVSATWEILYRLTHSVVAALALVGVQLLVVGWCYAQYRKMLAANPRPPLA
jgi:tetrahydromethanopterin S-methyltransferase subunit D